MDHFFQAALAAQPQAGANLANYDCPPTIVTVKIQSEIDVTGSFEQEATQPRQTAKGQAAGENRTAVRRPPRINQIGQRRKHKRVKISGK